MSDVLTMTILLLMLNQVLTIVLLVRLERRVREITHDRRSGENLLAKAVHLGRVYSSWIEALDRCPPEEYDRTLAIAYRAMVDAGWSERDAWDRLYGPRYWRGGGRK